MEKKQDIQRNFTYDPKTNLVTQVVDNTLTYVMNRQEVTDATKHGKAQLRNLKGQRRQLLKDMVELKELIGRYQKMTVKFKDEPKEEANENGQGDTGKAVGD